MGMFDFVKCKIPLPDTNEINTEDFQTKSLENLMLMYEIREDGTMWVEKVEYKWKKNINHPFGGSLRPIKKTRHWEQLTNVHQDVIFYGGRVQTSDDSTLWREYIARFSNGKMESLIYRDREW